ncbi:unnamed protein product [Mucor fragilis]
MDKLPLEVALLVSNHLSHWEKLECALTCHSWCTWFRVNGLFEKVSLRGAVNEDPHYYLSMLRFFEDTYGKSALSLSISVATMKLEDFSRLPGIFPNITKLQWMGDLPLNSDEDRKAFRMTVQKWRHIKAIDDGSSFHQITTALLEDAATAVQLVDIKLVYPVLEEETMASSEYKTNIDPPLHLARNAQSLTAINAPFTVSSLSMARESIDQFTTLRLLNLGYSNGAEDDIADEYFYDIEMDVQSNLASRDYCGHVKISNVLFRQMDSAIPLTTNAYSDFDMDFMYNRPMLKKWSMQLGRISRYLLEDMEEYNVGLEDLTVFVDGQSTDQFVLLQESSQTKSLKKLTIKEREKYTINGVYGRDMCQLIERIPQLEAVEIDTFRGSLLQHNPTVIVSILNSAPQIKSLKAPALISQSSGENTAVSHPCELLHLEISYCQFKLTTREAENINQTLKNILDKCPLLKTFSTQVNVYKDEASTDTNISLNFSFAEQPDMQSIQIKSLYETYFKFIVNGKTTCYHQKHGEMRHPVPNIDETKVYIQIEARNASIIDTSVMSDTP